MRKQRTGTKIGYARVSTKDQSTEQQVAALIAHGVDKDNIFIETVSGVSKRRGSCVGGWAAYAAAFAAL